MLLVLDGHGSHITIDVIEYARANDIYLLCLPSHTSHILQPLDIGVFKPFKSFFSKACRQYMAKNPGRVITEEILASVVGSAIAQSHTPLNILGGFKKAGIFPFNPGEVSDRQLAPSKALKKPTSEAHSFSPEQIKLFEQRFKEGYDLPDPAYLAWKSANHSSPESVSSANAATSNSITSPVSVGDTSSHKSSEEVLNELLTLPQPLSIGSGQSKKKAVNTKAIEITDDDVLQEMKDKEHADAEDKKKKEENKVERERRKKRRLDENERRKLDQVQKRLERAKKRRGNPRKKILKNPKSPNRFVQDIQ